MKTFFEQTLGLERSEVIARSLAAQVQGYGVLDIPLLTRELRPYAGGEALDVGTGNGVFLLKMAERNPDLQFIGLEHNADFLHQARELLANHRLANVQLRQAFFDAAYADTHEVIFTRFTLQHSSTPQEFVQHVYAVLKPGGLFVAIEPIYDYYDSDVPDPVWQGFCQRMFANYQRWGSDPNVPKRVCQWLAEAGFQSIRTSINMYSPITIGKRGFTAAVLTTAAALGFDHPDIWDAVFMEELERWSANPPGVPYVSIAHIVGNRGPTPSSSVVGSVSSLSRWPSPGPLA